jgi:Multicopper oxidase
MASCAHVLHLVCMDAAAKTCSGYMHTTSSAATSEPLLPLQVRIKNELPPDYPSSTNGGISIHWHGLSQRDEPWQVGAAVSWSVTHGTGVKGCQGRCTEVADSLLPLQSEFCPSRESQDGVAFVHQCPIMPGHEFTYRFPITDSPGTCESLTA